MKRRSESAQKEQLRKKIIGLGEKSIRKSYYPELQQRIAELERTNLELRQEIAERKKTQELNERLSKQLQQSMKMEAIGTLAGGIAHDFNNILTAIIGYTDLARINLKRQGAAPDCPVANDLDNLLAAGHRARSLVNQILTFSRQQQSRSVPVKLAEILQETLKLLRSTLPATIEVRTDIISGEGHILADPTQIHQIIMNLCTNAYQAMREKGGVLAVRLFATEISEDDVRVGRLDLGPGSYLTLEVSDSGMGMSGQVLERIFDPYFTTKADSGGTGMGMAVVHGIVRAHKGYINVYSEPGQGTTFKVYLPRVSAGRLNEVSQQQQAPPRGRERILLIDDEDFVLDLEKELLVKLGYRVTATASPLAGLDLFTRDPQRYDLVMTDMTMPRMNGAQLARKIFDHRPDTPVIICTGFSELLNREKALEMGVREFVMKPFVLREIAQTLRKVIDGG